NSVSKGNRMKIKQRVIGERVAVYGPMLTPSSVFGSSATRHVGEVNGVHENCDKEVYISVLVDGESVPYVCHPNQTVKLKFKPRFYINENDLKRVMESGDGSQTNLYAVYTSTPPPNQLFLPIRVLKRTDK
ncbi:MAG: hypothetical protein ACREGB_00185, partial [Candidatus Saccharimonadales bacterium]